MISKQKWWGRPILMGLWLMMFICCNQVVWAKDIQMSTMVGINGQSKFNRYIPINVTVENTGSDFTGRIQIVLGNSALEYSEEVNVAGGTNKTYIIPVNNNDNMYNSATVKLLDSSEKEVFKKVAYLNTNVIDMDQLAIGVLADDFSRVNYLKSIDLRLDTSYQTQTLQLEAKNIDEKAKNLDWMDILVINDYNTSELLPEQLQAIKKWIEQGGTLIVGTGSNANKTLSGLTKEVIPVTAKGSKQQQVQYLEDTLTLDLAQLEIESSEVIDSNNSGRYTDLYDAFSMGTGRVIVANYDLGLEPMASYSQNRDLWKQILTNELVDVEIEKHGTYYWSIENLANVLSSYLIDHKVLITILMIYIAIMGIIAYFILKKKQKKEYIWVVAPILSIGTTVLIYILSMGSRLEAFMVNQLDVIQVDQLQNANKTSYLGVLNIQGGDLAVTETDGIELGYLDYSDRYYDENAEVELTQRIEYSGDKLQYHMQNCSIYDTNVFVTEPRRAEAPKYTSSLVIDGQNYEVTLTNSDDQAIEHLLVIMNTRAWDLGSVESGETIHQVLKQSDAKEVYEFLYASEEANKEQERERIFEIFENIYFEQYYSNPIYLAITKNQEVVLPIVQGKYTSDFNYTMVLGELGLGTTKEGEIIYPYNYFKPYVVSQIGTGYLEEQSPVMTITDSLELELDYPVVTDCEINWINIGMSDELMWNTYYTDLKGQVYLYNYKTQDYEEIKISQGSSGYQIEKNRFEDYFKEDTIRLKVVGQGEDSALIPSIKVGGISHATN